VQLQQPAQSDPHPDEQHPNNSSGSGFIMHCALPFAVDAARAATDAHSKFYAMSLLSSVLEGATKLWSDLQEQLQQGHAVTSATAVAAAGDAPGSQSGSSGQGSGSSGGSGGGVTSGCLVVPWLRGTDAEAIMSLLSSQLDEPVAQVGLVLERVLGCLYCPGSAIACIAQGGAENPTPSRYCMRCAHRIHRAATQSHLGLLG
jgi:hypothetical protein